MGTYYIASGSVCGDCSHRHRTPEAAERCCQTHNRVVKRGNPGNGSYSDRHPRAVDGGVERHLTESERVRVWAAQRAA